MTGPRDLSTRRNDSLRMLSTPAIDVWVASASAGGVAHLVPLSLCWHDERAVVAIDGGSPTAANLPVGARARLAVGPTRDVTMIDAVVERVVPVEDDDTLYAAYTGQADWDPRRGTGYLFVVLVPERIQAWREADEIPGRTLMRSGTWLS